MSTTLTNAITTVTLGADVEQINLSTHYTFVWVKNQSEGDIFASLTDNVAGGVNGTMKISAGEFARIDMDMADRLYLSGSGDVLLKLQNYSDCPFRAGRKGGGNGILSGTISYNGTDSEFYFAELDIELENLEDE